MCKNAPPPNARNAGKTHWSEILESSLFIFIFLFIFLFFFKFKSYKPFRGGWTYEEDLEILEFVIKNGSQWSKLSRNLFHRTEHCVKNRFFSLLSQYLLISVKKIKQNINYLSASLLKETIKNIRDNKAILENTGFDLNKEMESEKIESLKQKRDENSMETT